MSVNTRIREEAREEMREKDRAFSHLFSSPLHSSLHFRSLSTYYRTYLYCACVRTYVQLITYLQITSFKLIFKPTLPMTHGTFLQMLLNFYDFRAVFMNGVPFFMTAALFPRPIIKIVNTVYYKTVTHPHTHTHTHTHTHPF